MGWGHLGGETVPGEAVRAMRPTSREKEGPAPPASHRGVCRPGVPHAAGAPVAGAQTTLSTHTRERTRVGTEGEGTACLVPPVNGGPRPGGTPGGGRCLALHPPSGPRQLRSWLRHDWL